MLSVNENKQKDEYNFLKSFTDLISFDVIPTSIDGLSDLIKSTYRFKHSNEIDNLMLTIEIFREKNIIKNEKFDDFFDDIEETLENYRNGNQGKGIHLLLQERGYKSVKKYNLDVVAVDNKPVKKLPSSLEILNINLNQLNARYNKYGIKFELAGDIVKVFEAKPYLMNDYPEIKDFLKAKFFMCFSTKNKWYFGKQGIKFLSSKVINLQRKIDILEIKEKLYFIVDLIAEFDLKMSLVNFFKKYPDFFESAAAITYHHAYKGGLAEHTIQVVEFALKVAENLDVGKMDCYKTTDDFVDVTDKLVDQGHIINGISILVKEIKSKKLEHIKHVLASHHFLKEWGSPVQPNSVEAWIVYLADNLSAKLC